jgi:hypothetical protein
VPYEVGESRTSTQQHGGATDTKGKLNSKNDEAALGHLVAEKAQDIKDRVVYLA